MKDYLSKSISLGLITVTGVLTFLLLYFTLPYHDDIIYSSVSKYPSFSAYLVSYVTFDSPRFFNLLFPFIMQSMPKWTANLLTALTFTLSIMMVAKVAGISTRRFLRIGIIILFMEFALPWDNGMTCTIFSTNYIWPLPLVLSFIICFTNKEYSKKIHPAILVLIGLITGWAQEGESLPLLIGILSWCAMNRRWPTKRQLCLSIPLAITCVTIIITSIWTRYAKQDVNPSLFSQPISQLVYISMTMLNGTLIMSAIIGVMALFRKTRKRLWEMREGPMVITLAAMYTSYVVGLALWQMGERLTWYPQFFAILAGAIILNNLWMKPIVTNRKTSLAVTSLITAFVSCHLISAAIITRKISHLTNIIQEEYLAQDSSDPLYEMVPITRLPVMAWNKLGVADITVNRWTWSVHSHHFAGKMKPFPAPDELRNVTPLNITKVPGDSPLYRYKDLLLMADDGTRGELVVKVEFRFGVDRRIALNLTPFTADDGKRWIYAFSPISDIQTRWIPITEINLTE